MEFDWANFKTLAEELRQRDDEASQRSAISRLYYSVFNRAQAYLKEKHGFQVSAMGESSHKAMWNEYGGKGKTSKAIAIKGNRLRLNRNDADYNPTIHKLDNLVEESFREAESILSYLQNLP